MASIKMAVICFAVFIASNSPGLLWPQSAVLSVSALRAEPFIAMEEPGAPGKTDRRKLEQCLHLMVHELGLEGRELPRTIIYHISQRSANYLGIDGSAMYRNTGSGHVRYEVWVVGEPSHFTYSYLFLNVLTSEFKLSMLEADRVSLLHRVVTRLSATIDATSFR